MYDNFSFICDHMVHERHRYILRLAIPVILANASVPLLGLADTAAIGQTAGAAELGAIALASLVFSFIYWGFGFLRMGTTGFVSQAMGAKDTDEVHALVFRSVLLGGAIGVVLIALQWFIGWAAVGLLQASEEIKTLVLDYFYIRIWGAPATLITFALLGAFIGAGWTRELLITQLFLNGFNIVLNVLFVVVLDFGVKGIALGTMLAEWTTLFLAGYILWKKLEMGAVTSRFRQLRVQVFNRLKIISILRVNGDIMLRTLALLSGFAWFANQGAAFGDTILAANHVLLQFVSLSAFFLDGYAHVAEMLSGKAYGARDRVQFKQQFRDSTQLAAVTALILAVGIYFGSDVLVPLLTRDVAVQGIALQHSIYAAIYIALSFAAFQLDGVFIGITKSREMRNATIMALLIFIISAWWLADAYANAGLWIAFIIYVVARAILLGYYYVRLQIHDKKL